MSSPRIERAAAAAAASRMSSAAAVSASHEVGGTGNEGFSQLLELAGSGNMGELAQEAGERSKNASLTAEKSARARTLSTDDHKKTVGNGSASSNQERAESDSANGATDAGTTAASSVSGQQNERAQSDAERSNDDDATANVENDAEQASSDAASTNAMLSQEEIAALLVAHTMIESSPQLVSAESEAGENAATADDAETTARADDRSLSITELAAEAQRAAVSNPHAKIAASAHVQNSVATTTHAQGATEQTNTAIAAATTLGAASRANAAPKNPTRDLSAEEQLALTASRTDLALFNTMIDPQRAVRPIETDVAHREIGTLIERASDQGSQNLRGMEALLALSTRSAGAAGKLETHNAAGLAKLAERAQQLASIREQAGNAAFAALRGGRRESELQLDPPEMGRIAIRIITQRDHVHVAFFAEKPLTKEALERDFSQLRDLLQGSQLQLGNTFVDMGDSQNNWAQQLAEWRKLYDGVLATPEPVIAGARAAENSGGTRLLSRLGEVDARV